MIKIPNIPKLKVKKIKKPFRIVALCFFAILGIFIYYHFIFFDRAYPNVHIAGIHVGGKTQQETKLLITKLVNPKKITLTSGDESYVIDTNSFQLKYDYALTSQSALDHYDPQKSPGNLILSLQSLISKTNIPIIYTLDETLLIKELEDVANKIKLKEPIYPGVDYQDGNIVIEMGSPGESVDKEKLVKDIKNYLSNPTNQDIEISLIIDDPSITQEQATILSDRANILLGKYIAFTFEYSTYELTQEDTIRLLAPQGGYKKDQMEIVALDIKEEFEREPQNPIFVFENGRVKEFKPAKDGITLNEDGFYILLENALKEIEETDKEIATINLPTISTLPDYNTSEVNDLGIRELIGRGLSRYAGSIASRIHNVSHAASKFNGVLVKPGETFSFNQTLGDVSSETGYKQAYVIKNGRTELGDGGGVCQVSTTLFRAALDAGLPITERRAHSYRVSYYEQGSPPGIDATVYEPSPDLKFTNDTPGHILIQSFADSKALTLAFEIYGTSDGRVSTISKPVVSGVTPPPEDLYIDDPTLPAGTVKQIDWKAWGAKVVFDYTVEKNGVTTIDETYVSSYKPWQAIFLRGTGPAQ